MYSVALAAFFAAQPPVTAPSQVISEPPITAQQAVPQAPNTPPATPNNTIGQPPATSAAPAPGTAGTPVGGPTIYRAKLLLGTRVSIQNNTAIGVIDDVVFNDEGMVEYLLVANDGRLSTVPWQAAKFNFDQRTAYVDIAPDTYRRIPTFTLNAYPGFTTPTYRTEIYRYYGMTPGQQRRAERAAGVR